MDTEKSLDEIKVIYDRKEELQKVNQCIISEQWPNTDDTINVLLLGRSRSGKTTMIEVLKNPGYISPEGSIFKGTVDPEGFDKIEIINGKRVRFIDTPGLFENTKSGEMPRSNDELLKLIKNYLFNKKINRIHRVFITLTVMTGINQNDIDAINFYINNLLQGQVKENIISFVITHSERILDIPLKGEQKTGYDKIIDQIKNDSRLKDVLKKINERVYFSGSLSKSEIAPLKPHIIRINKMRERLLNHIINESQNPINIFC